jgi:hypothetical protein
MLHDPLTLAAMSRFIANSHRYAALKAASRLCKEGDSEPKRILLRATNSKIIREFSGQIKKLDQPQVIKRGDREITYTKKPHVSFVKAYNWPDKDTEAPVEVEGSQP